MRLRVLALTRYSAIAASARYRFYDLQAGLRSRGVDLEIHPLLPDDYVQTLRVRGWRVASGIAAGYARRVGDLARRGQWDALVVQYETLPFVPAFLESLFLRGATPYVLDYDDAWFHRYDSHRSPFIRQVLGPKIPRLMEEAQAVIAGSKYLANFASQFNKSVITIPTTIDLARYPDQQAERDPGQRPVIGWIGSPATTRFLKLVRDPLLKVMQETGARLRLVGADPSQVDIQGAEIVPWRAETEIAELESFDVGIMPLADEPIARGKCAFKLLQYMGAWRPTVASPVGENTQVVRAGESGFLASGDDQWHEALVSLLSSPARAAAFGRAGRYRISLDYDQPIAVESLHTVLRSAMGDRSIV